MAKQRNRGNPGARRGGRRPPQPAEGGFLWNLTGCISVISAILLFVGAGVPEWRTSNPIAYHYSKGGQYGADSFLASSYGLYMVKFNGGAVQKNWSRLQNQICAGIDALAPILEGTSVITSPNCGTSCISHYRTRCSAYGKLQLWGFFVLATLIVCGCLGLIAAGWLFIFGVNRVVLQLIWIGGGCFAAAATGYWIMISDSYFRAMNVESQYPYPSLDFGVFVTLIATLGFFVCGALAALSAFLADRREWRRKEEEIQRRILGDTGLGQGDFIGGPPPGQQGFGGGGVPRGGIPPGPQKGLRAPSPIPSPYAMPPGAQVFPPQGYPQVGSPYQPAGYGSPRQGSPAPPSPFTGLPPNLVPPSQRRYSSGYG